MGQLDEIDERIEKLHGRMNKVGDMWTEVVNELLLWRDNAHRIAEAAHYNGYEAGLKESKAIQREAFIHARSDKSDNQGREEK